MFDKVLVANRGEIAVRILRTLREMGIRSVAVYSDADRESPHVELADEAHHIGGARPSESYLNAERVLEAARRSGAQALIPGYGFLSENASFARQCGEAGIVFVGPRPDAIEIMGLKPQARAQMQAAGVPVVPGGSASDLAQARETAHGVGYPVMLKAAAGGGGRGMRRVSNGDELEQGFDRARREAEGAFGDGTLYVEKVISPARHVEVQVLGDTHGQVVHLFERDCSMQRRHQKVVEECPSPRLPQEALERLCQTAVLGARSVNYSSAGTFEFLVDQENDFYFLEMNTRLQVEHPITELTTGLDLVREMLRVAAGEPLGYGQEDIVRGGVAIECRIYAEDPARGFMPSPGQVERIRPPEGPGVRHDSGVRDGFRMGFDYDAMLSKLCAWAPTRQLAVARMKRALSECEVSGLTTNLTFLERLVSSVEFESGVYDTGTIEARSADWLSEADGASLQDDAAVAMVVASLMSQGRPPASAPTPSGSSAWVSAHRRRRVGL